MASTSRRSSRQSLTTHVTDSSNSNIIFHNLLKISLDTRFALTRSSGTLGVHGVAPGRLGCGSSTVAGVDIDDVVVWNAIITDINAEQRCSILTDIVIILDFQVLLSLGVRAVEGGTHPLRPWRPEARTGDPALQHRSSTVHAGGAWPCLRQRTKTRHQTPTCKAKRRKVRDLG